MNRSDGRLVFVGEILLQSIVSTYLGTLYNPSFCDRFDHDDSSMTGMASVTHWQCFYDNSNLNGWFLNPFAWMMSKL